MRIHFFNIRNFSFNDDDPGCPAISLDVEVIRDSGERIIEEMIIDSDSWTTTTDEFNDVLNEHSHDDFDDASDSLNSIFERLSEFLKNISMTDDEINEILNSDQERQ